MNTLSILLSVFICTSPLIHEGHELPVDSAINHVVTYVTYTNPSQGEEDNMVCTSSLYLFSNHSNRIIEVDYKEMGKTAADVKTTTLSPVSIQTNSTGDSRTITRPQKIDIPCETTYEILNARYID